MEITDKPRGTYNKGNQIRFKSSMLRSSLCDYSDAYLLVKGNITVANKKTQGQPNNATNKKLKLKSWPSFTNCWSRVNNTQVDDPRDIDVVMPMYNLIGYSDN